MLRAYLSQQNWWSSPQPSAEKNYRCRLRGYGYF